MVSAMSTFRKLYYLPAVCLPLLAASADNLPHAESNAFTFDALTVPTDSDHDGMPDAWESTYGLNHLLDDASANPDGDTFTNLEEYNAGTNPIVADNSDEVADESDDFVFSTIALDADSDSDGLPDWWEALYTFNGGQSGALDDPDGDGLNNLAEFNGGWNPDVANTLELQQADSGFSLTDTGAYPLGFSYDSDNDTMPDWWEEQYGLIVGVNDSAGNPDGDDLSNAEEYAAGRIPNLDDQFGEGFDDSADFTADTVGREPDTDSDLMPDAWETANGLNPLVADANADPDEDGWSNLEEYNAGTNPQIDEWVGPDRLASALSLVDTGAYPLGFSYDTDSDGMPDWWEDSYGLNRVVNDASNNPDSDLYTNVEEYQRGLHPYQSDYIFVIDGEGGLFLLDTGGEFVDSDLDGIPNWWERKYSGNSTTFSPTLDADHDGQNNLAEYIAGLNPLDASSVFEINSASLDTAPQGVMTVEWQTKKGRTYHMYFNENVGQLNGTATFTVIGDGTMKSKEVSKSGRTRLFCRISVEMSPAE